MGRRAPDPYHIPQDIEPPDPLKLTGRTMPMKVASHSGRAADARPEAGPVRVLLVDDSPAFLRALRNLIGDWAGIEVLDMVNSGELAVERVRELRPDLVLMDISMPGMGGLEATRRIKAQPGAPRVVFVSLEDRATLPTVRGLGGDGFVSKTEVFERLMPAIVRLFPGLVRAVA